MSWYYMDSDGQTQGPFHISVLQNKYKSKELNDNSYVWNSANMNKWTYIKNVFEFSFDENNADTKHGLDYNTIKGDIMESVAKVCVIM